MIETEEIVLGLREQVDGIRAACGHEAASHAFHSLFLWRADMSLSICLREDAFAVRCGLRGEGCWFFPCGEREAAARLVEDLLAQERRLRLIYVREEDAALLEERFPGRFQTTEADGDSEYLYERTTLTEMKGKKFLGIRKSIHHLEREHEMRVETWDAENVEALREVILRWQPRSTGENGLEDRAASLILLENRLALDIFGIVVYMDGAPVGMAAGFPLGPRSFDMAFAKAVVMENGLAHFTRHAFSASLPPERTIINGEEDMGVPGLRQLKRNLSPMGQIRMYQSVCER